MKTTELWVWRITIIILLAISFWQEIEITRLYKMFSQQMEVNELQQTINSQNTELFGKIVDKIIK